MPPSKPDQPSYDHVIIKNMQDGSLIEGHEAVKAYFGREEQLAREHGRSLIFEVYRLDPRASSLAMLQGPMLAEIRADGGLVSGTDTVAAVLDKLRPLLEMRARPLELDANDQITLFFCDQRMRPDSAFYSDHYVLLPAWFQVLVHRGPFEAYRELATRLGESGAIQATPGECLDPPRS